MTDLATGFSREIVLASDYAKDIPALMAGSGRTDRYSTGIHGLDEYLFGGYGRPGKWEIVVIHASYGVGKSTLGIAMLAEPIKAGVPVGIMALEDDPGDVVVRLNSALGGTAELISPHLSKVHLMPQASLERLWTYDELLKEIERWFIDLKVEILLFDHLQFAFDSAQLGDEKDQWRAQASFMFRLNVLMKKMGDKTLILISQQNKQREIAGSIATPRLATKMIRMEKSDGAVGLRKVQLEKSRATPERGYPYIIELTGRGVADTKNQVGVTKNEF